MNDDDTHKAAKTNEKIKKKIYAKSHVAYDQYAHTQPYTHSAFMVTKLAINLLREPAPTTIMSKN